MYRRILMSNRLVRVAKETMRNRRCTNVYANTPLSSPCTDRNTFTSSQNRRFYCTHCIPRGPCANLIQISPITLKLISSPLFITTRFTIQYFMVSTLKVLSTWMSNRDHAKRLAVSLDLISAQSCLELFVSATEKFRTYFACVKDEQCCEFHSVRP